MRPGLSIRPYRDADNAALAALWFEASRAVHGFFTEEALREQQVLVAEQYLPGSETWVAEDATGPLGFIGLVDDFIGGLFVAPSVQGQGVGRALVDHALARKGQLALEAYEANGSARAFYTRLGFRETGRRAEDDLGNPFPLVRLQRDG